MSVARLLYCIDEKKYRNIRNIPKKKNKQKKKARGKLVNNQSTNLIVWRQSIEMETVELVVGNKFLKKRKKETKRKETIFVNDDNI